MRTLPKLLGPIFNDLISFFNGSLKTRMALRDRGTSLEQEFFGLNVKVHCNRCWPTIYKGLLLNLEFYSSVEGEGQFKPVSQQTLIMSCTSIIPFIKPTTPPHYKRKAHLSPQPCSSSISYRSSLLIPLYHTSTFRIQFQFQPPFHTQGNTINHWPFF